MEIMLTHYYNNYVVVRCEVLNQINNICYVVMREITCCMKCKLFYMLYSDNIYKYVVWVEGCYISGIRAWSVQSSHNVMFPCWSISVDDTVDI